MNKGIYGVLGIIIAGVVFAGYWALNIDNPQPPTVTSSKKPPQKISLLSINYIPTAPAKEIDDVKYWETVDGGEAVEKSMSNLKGKPIILHLWATWCGPCVKELPDLDAFAEKQKNTAHILAIATDLKEADKVRAFYKAKGINNLTIAFDKSGTLTRTFRASGLPTTVFINSKGHEIGRIQGMIEWSGLPGKVIKAHLTKQ